MNINRGAVVEHTGTPLQFSADGMSADLMQEEIPGSAGVAVAV
jgi:hypothetical protein